MLRHRGTPCQNLLGHSATCRIVAVLVLSGNCLNAPRLKYMLYRGDPAARDAMRKMLRRCRSTCSLKRMRCEGTSRSSPRPTRPPSPHSLARMRRHRHERVRAWRNHARARPCTNGSTHARAPVNSAAVPEHARTHARAPAEHNGSRARTRRTARAQACTQEHTCPRAHTPQPC